MKWCVLVSYRGTSNFVVEAESAEDAEAAARKAYADGETPPLLGNEHEEIESIIEIEQLDQT